MDTSNNQNFQDFKVIDLEKSQHSEDRELAVKAEEVVKVLIEKLKPVLRYIATPVPFIQGDYRAIALGEMGEAGRGGTLFLLENGHFIVGELDSSCKDPNHYQFRSSGSDLWKLIPLGVLIASLEKALREAEEKREQHLQAVKERREKLDEILQILKK